MQQPTPRWHIRSGEGFILCGRRVSLRWSWTYEIFTTWRQRPITKDSHYCNGCRLNYNRKLAERKTA